MKYIRNILVFYFAISIFTFNLSFADNNFSPEQILYSADLARGNTKGLEWIIKIDAIENGKRQKNTLLLKASRQNSLAEYLSPAKVKGRKLLMQDRNMWFIKPGLSKPVPISPRQKLLGGASNGDIASTDYSGDYTITDFSQDARFNNQSCYLFDLKANNKKVTYDKIKYWVSKENLTGVKADFFTISGKLFKTATFEYKIIIKNKPRLFVSKMVIKNSLLKNNVTTMYYSKVKIKTIPASTFNLNLLTR